MSEAHPTSSADFPPQVGRFVAMLEDTRGRLLGDLETLDEVYLDRGLPWDPNSISTLLYHIAAIELDWTFADIRETSSFPQGASDWFPVPVRDEDGRLAPFSNSLQRHVERLEWVRGHLLDTIADLTDADLDRVVTNADDGSTNTIGWILHHLMQHEAEHRGQIGELRNALRTL
jgi:hypothetical protein